MKQEETEQSTKDGAEKDSSTEENPDEPDDKTDGSPALKDDEQKLCASMMSIGTNSVEMRSLSNLDMPIKAIPLEGLELTVAPQFAKYLVLAIRDRLRHGRHFTLKSESTAITFVSELVGGTVVTKAMPYALQSFWMQVLIPNDLIPYMVEKLESLVDYEDNSSDSEKVFEWPDHYLKIIIGNPVQESQCLI